MTERADTAVEDLKRQSRTERCCGHLADNFGD